MEVGELVCGVQQTAAHVGASPRFTPSLLDQGSDEGAALICQQRKSVSQGSALDEKGFSQHSKENTDSQVLSAMVDPAIGNLSCSKAGSSGYEVPAAKVPPTDCALF